MNNLIPGLLLVLTLGNAFAQKAPIKFGEISVEDLKMERYDKDSSASAVVLTDYGVSSLVYNQSQGFSVMFERIIRIKVLTKDGLDWATFAVPLYHDGGDNEKFSALKAVTYNFENNKVVETKLKSDGVFKEKVDENYDIMKFTLPNVRQGSIVEVSYKVNSDFLFNFQDWEFQRSIPTRWSEYRAHIPEFYFYDRYMQGYVPLAVNEEESVASFLTLTNVERSDGGRGGVKSEFVNDKIDFKENRYRWAAKDVPAFKEESFITTSRDYISKMNFELAYQKFPNQPIKNYMGSWTDINKLFSDSPNFGQQVKGNGFLKKITEEVTTGLTTPEQKINAINNYVKTSFEWNTYSRKYTESPLKKVMEEKKGNSSDLNLLMASMLDKAGFTVFPVLISTRDHGFVREATPISSQFNYALCLVKLGDKQILLDATERLLPTGALPERCLNGRGFVVSEAGFSWIPLASTVRSRTSYNAEFMLSPEGELKGKLLVDRSGYPARASRKNYISKGEAQYVKDFVSNKTWTIGKSEFKNAKEITEPFKEAHEVVINDHVVASDAVMYLNPFVVLQEKDNPFKPEKREYPVDFGSSFERLYICRITIPEGFVVDEMPQSRLLKLPENAARYTYNVACLNNVLTLTSHLVISNSLFTQDEYPHLREFYSQIIAKQAEQVVLKKK